MGGVLVGVGNGRSVGGSRKWEECWRDDQEKPIGKVIFKVRLGRIGLHLILYKCSRGLLSIFFPGLALKSD
jgi:hypothetical protein